MGAPKNYVLGLWHCTLGLIGCMNFLFDFFIINVIFKKNYI